MAEATATAVAATTNSGAAASAAAPSEQPATTEVPSTVLGSTEPAATTTASATQGDKPTATAPASTEAKPDAAKADDKTGPVEYAAFKFPEGAQVDETRLNDFKAFAKSNNLNQEQAQAFIDRQLADNTQAEGARVERFKAQRSEWKGTLKADKEWGGDKLPQTEALARKGIAEYGTPELKDLLNRTGFGDFPGLVIAFAKIGKTLSEDAIRTGSAAKAATKSAASALYPTQK